MQSGRPGVPSWSAGSKYPGPPPETSSNIKPKNQGFNLTKFTT